MAQGDQVIVSGDYILLRLPSTACAFKLQDDVDEIHSNSWRASSALLVAIFTMAITVIKVSIKAPLLPRRMHGSEAVSQEVETSPSACFTEAEVRSP